MDVERVPWGPAKTAGFRALTIFVLAYLAPLGVITDRLVPLVGHHVLGIEGEIPVEMTGSGDTLAEYVRLLLFVVVAVGGTGLWTVLRGPRVRYVRLLHWITFAIRIVLCTTMLGYGFAKVFDGQFGEPGTTRLLRTYGESSPMGLLWTFMGQSKAYCVFTGLAEVVGGLLLLPRRTQTLGALVIVGVMSNVVMLNFCYDVPVKLFSMRLLGLALFLVALDRRRLLAVFLRNAAAPASPSPQLFSRPRRHFVGQVVKALYAGVLVLGATAAYAFGVGKAPESSAVELEGLYEVQTFVRDGVEVPPLTTDEERWRRLVVGRYFSTVQGMTGEMTTFKAELDEGVLTLTEFDFREELEAPETWVFGVDRPTDDLLVLRAADGAPLTITLARRDDDDFLLRSRGFHWIQEVPFNR